MRSAVPADALAIARVHVRAWQAGFRGLLPDDYLANLVPEERAQRYTLGITDGSTPQTIVAVVEGEIRGFATTGMHEGEPLLHALYVDPDHWSTGLGRTLIAEARAELRRAGHHEAALWSLVGNTRAERFYLSDGWLPEGSPRLEEVWGAEANQQRYRRKL